MKKKKFIPIGLKQPQVYLNADNRSFSSPIYQSVSFDLPSVEEWESRVEGGRAGYTYSSSGNPTVHALELLLADMQGQERCMVVTTGKLAMGVALFSLLRQGDHVILLREAYKSTRFVIEKVLAKFGVSFSIVPVDDITEVDASVIPGKTKLLLLESPTNPMTRVPDFELFLALAREYQLTTILDNSTAGFHNHGEFPFDLFIHSLSKFGTGTGDVMGGAILGRAELISKIRLDNIWNADCIDAVTAHTLLKGMNTYDLRLERQCANAVTVAKFLENHPGVERVLYPGLPSHPDYSIAQKQMKDFGTILSFDVKEGAEKMYKTINTCKRFALTVGTGYCQSIINPARMFYARHFSEEQTGISAINDNTIRLSLGIEPAQELLDDLDTALR